MVFWEYSHGDREYWVSTGVFQKYLEKSRHRVKAFRSRHPERLSGYQRKWASKNRKTCVGYQTAFRKRHPDRIREYARAYYKHRRDSDISYRLEIICRNRVRAALKCGATKAAKTAELIGCSIDQLRQHLEDQFRPGMTWDNWGMGGSFWQIDHIRPCASFDLSDPEQQKRCFHYTNLQPLWEKDNYAKSDKWQPSKIEV